MGLFLILRRLFKRTAEQPPRIEPTFPPAGLQVPDAPEMLAPLLLPEAAPVIMADVVTLSLAEPDAEPPPMARRPRRATAERPFGEAIQEDLYGLTFMIEYQAGSGDFSRRRIQLRSATRKDDGHLYLRALCYERQAPRTFRFDRIRRIIDSDGVVHESAHAFFRDELRLDLDAAAPPAAATATARPALAAGPVTLAPPDQGTAEKAGMVQRRLARDGLRVLIALARADGNLHDAELEAVLDYVEAACGHAGVACGHDDRTALRGYLRRQRPGLDVLDDCLQRLDRAPLDAQRLLLDYADRVINADGERHDAEHEMLTAIRRSLGAINGR